ncbi:MAG: aminopeptidase N, partial [Kordiimonas sp.]
IQLTFLLFDDHAIVIAENQVRRCGDHNNPLRLDGGQYMQLQALKVDGEIVGEGDFKCSPTYLELPNVPDEFTLTVTTKLKPHENTRLEGLYHSGGNFCTQCEAEGFRHITYCLDRPDVLAVYSVRIEADQGKFPVLLSNGNKVDAGDLEEGRHFAEWHDPHPKPSYLFALVAGSLACRQDHYTTKSGNQVELNIYVAPQDIDKSAYAMGALQRAMKWDEDVFGLEYDLDVYNIVAVSDFNMGAMENKGLNIFNTKYVLASAETATDSDFSHVEGVIGHEYFHNWTGNRVTCRDWFQLSLKEGLTVFRDQEFTSDLASRALKRIDDVRVLRMLQFPEDAGPLAHPVRPEKYIEINNFYTVTIYNKGAEVIRMMHTLIGAQAFRRGMDLYFDRFDGQAVTCEDFVRSMEDASGANLTQFRLWYSQAGTPTIELRQKRSGDVVEVTLKQTCAATPGQQEKQPFHMPFVIGWLDKDGNTITPEVQGSGVWRGEDCILNVSERAQTFSFMGVPEGATLSPLRRFSAPVRLDHDLDQGELSFLVRHDTDAFVRWESAQTLASAAILGEGQKSDTFKKAFREALEDVEADPALVAELISLPSEVDLGQRMESFDAIKLHKAREKLIQELAKENHQLLASRYADEKTGDYDLSSESKSKRRLRNAILGYLAFVPEGEEVILGHYHTADNMTDRMAALTLIAHSDYEARAEVLSQFYKTWQTDALVIDKWFAVQALSKRNDTVDVVKALTKHKEFSFKNPNRVRSLVSSFSMMNQVSFHTTGGEGYRFLAEVILEVDKVNPQTAAKLVAPLGRFGRLDKESSLHMQNALRWIVQQENLSDDVCELCEKSLA